MATTIKKPVRLSTEYASPKQFQTEEAVGPEHGGTGKTLTDLTGKAGEYLKVNSGEDGFEFDTPAGGGGGASYSAYIALLTQSGTSDPVATVLENTLSGAIVWTRDSDGTYLGTLSGAFVSGKTFLICGSLISTDDPGNVPTPAFWRLDSDTVKLVTYLGGFSQDLWEASIEIRVYP